MSVSEKKNVLISFDIYSLISSNVVINNFENKPEERRFPIIYNDRSLMLSNRKHDSIPLLYYEKDIKKSKVLSYMYLKRKS